MKVKIEGRLAWPQIWEPKPMKNDDGTTRYVFSGTVIFPPGSPAEATVKEAQRAVAEEAWPGKGLEMLTTLANKDRVCLHDGAEKAIKYDGFEGMMYVSANGKVRPAVRDANATPLVEKDGRPYPGCYVILIVDIYAQKDHPKGGNRINAQLMGVQFLRDGDSFGGGKPASDDDFADVSAAAGANADPWRKKTGAENSKAAALI